MKLKKFLLLFFLCTSFRVSNAQYLELSPEKAPLNWFNLDYLENGVRGISTERAYRDFLNGKTSKSVLVAIIDSGVDINHEDLKDNIWVNTKEIPNNGVDDDNNGYIDDINGWDFLGGKDGTDVSRETMEVTREYARLKKIYQYIQDISSLSPAMKVEYELYKKYKARYEAKVQELQEQGPFVIKLYEKYIDSKLILSTFLKVKDISKEDLAKITTKEPEEIRKAKRVFELLEQIGQDEEKLKEAYEYYDAQFKFGINLSFNPRTIVGDDVDNINDRDYGNNEVKGPDARHGTHVAGIVAANRNNSLGIAGVASNVKIMAIRAVPEGDERDKDVSNAIRYAVDNGAKIINMSFGKSVSPQKQAVDDAVRYAQSKGVLLIHAAGNENENIDISDNYPSKKFDDGKQADNWLEVGATSWMQPPSAVAEFSNYGHKTVDVFAPGVDLKSTVVGSQYEDLSGTSMAAPVVTGLAALLMSYYPDFDFRKIKQIILNSSIKLNKLKVSQPGTGELVDFSLLSSSGGIVNAYEAVKMAEEELKFWTKK
ncbi:subtilase family protein [Arcicella aurantiaca]|uniref:Subtilase family protein n=1 Tax=Arcicella aurantiaca TaxID=591202 RepID=A0A316E8W5_9BACT|nr:S8 family peptidase [Arcicella aurantiaca]PWK25173.1 subtilase family protein [Arcicella aurantiaca]